MHPAPPRPPRRILLVRAFEDPDAPTRGFADSLAAGAAAAALESPLLLTDSTTLGPEVSDYLDRTPSVEEVVIIGGGAAIAPSVAQDLEGRGLSVIRVAGADRRATAAAVTRFALEANGADAPPPAGGTYIMLDAEDPLAWADGFAAAGLADAAQGGGVLLIDDVVPRATLGVLADAVAGTSAFCGSMVEEQVCRDAIGAHATTQPEELAVADLSADGIVGTARVQRTGDSLCVIVALEGARLAQGVINRGFGELPPPGEDGRIVMCRRWISDSFTIGQLLENGAEVVVMIDDRARLRGALEASLPA